ncbi:2-amino-5-chloromuconate deaminase CnbZ [Aurantimonas endophytica]|uniref:RidA family protein n=1 Tax=Aurantimonas endophytica TaxID=1522175 RepID=A0A7W6HDK4_9HYPH|nr:hypothetical protein [Aurantimonas endophytica]MBB4003246.1 hypothetical protein [Aurantimonas endophytica]MCO6404108.1 hypothetical protein [Aurantimonas endophytica]
MSLVEMREGGYAYIPLVMQFSAGVVARPGYRMQRVRFSQPVPVAEGFEKIAAHLAAVGRPLTAFCACELRSPAPFTEETFLAFNRVYAGTLREWGVMEGDANPVARSHVCPAIDPPATPSFHAFSYTVPDEAAAPSFVVAGSCEVAELGEGEYVDRIVRHGDTSTEGLADKARFVLAEMERRLGLFDAGWADTTAVQVYTVHDLGAVYAELIGPTGAARNGLAWHYNRPPVIGLDFEMDCRRVEAEFVIPA